MSEIHFEISAVDTLLFRDGQPFNQGDAGASIASSVFPPYPPTLVGALRAMFWNSIGSWEVDKLGTGTNWQVEDEHNKLTPLQFSAPIIMKAKEPVFPIPLHVIKGKSGSLENVFSYLAPKDDYKCDLGNDVQLPAPICSDLEGIKTISDHWVNMQGMQCILSGHSLDESHFVKQSDLWTVEPRVGIGIERKSRSTSDGKLYMASHIRMADDVALSVNIRGLDPKIKISHDANLCPLAGEHRMAGVNKIDAIEFPIKDITQNGKGICIVAISPVVPNFNQNNCTIKGIDSDDLVSACLGKPISIGGWNSQKKQPLPLKNCYPSGSVWFLKPGANIPSEIGDSTNWGFGQILIGTW